MIGNGGVPVQFWIEPNFMASGCLTVEFQTELFQALYDSAITETRQISHQVAMTSG
jgi:hypothetical protein